MSCDKSVIFLLAASLLALVVEASPPAVPIRKNCDFSIINKRTGSVGDPMLVEKDDAFTVSFLAWPSLENAVKFLKKRSAISNNIHQIELFQFKYYSNMSVRLQREKNKSPQFVVLHSVSYYNTRQRPFLESTLKRDNQFYTKLVLRNVHGVSLRTERYYRITLKPVNASEENGKNQKMLLYPYSHPIH